MKKPFSSIARTLLIGAVMFNASVVAAGELDAVEDALDRDKVALGQSLFDELTDEIKSSFMGQIYKGRLMLSRDEYDDAEAFYEDLVERYPEQAEAHYLYGATNMTQAQHASIFSKMGYAEKGLEHLHKAVELDPTHRKGHVFLSQFYSFAPGMVGGDVNKAREHAAIVKTLDAEQGIELLAGIEARHESEEAGLAVLQKGLEALPESSRLHHAMALRLQEDENWGAAREHLQLALNKANDDEDKYKALYQVGRTAVLSESQLEEGIAAFEQVLNNADDTRGISIDWAHYRAAQLYVLHKDKAGAKAHYDQALAMTSDKELQKKLKKMKRKLK